MTPMDGLLISVTAWGLVIWLNLRSIEKAIREQDRGKVDSKP